MAAAQLICRQGAKPARLASGRALCQVERDTFGCQPLGLWFASGALTVAGQHHRSIDGPCGEAGLEHLSKVTGKTYPGVGSPVPMGHNMSVWRVSAVNDQCQIIGGRPGHCDELITIGGQLSCLVHCSAWHRARVGASKSSQRDKHDLTWSRFDRGRQAFVIADQKVRASTPDKVYGGPDRPRCHGPVQRSPVRWQGQPDDGAGAKVVLVLKSVAGLGDPVGQDLG